MGEFLEIAEGGKDEKYSLLLKQVKALAVHETDKIAFLGNVTSMIHFTFGFLWTGFYKVCGSVLVLWPFQGPMACSRINYGKGVCGTAWKEGRTVIVDDVNEFPGHIACSSDSKSEIVVPVVVDGRIEAVLDIDSEKLSTFDETDAIWLNKINNIVAKFLSHSH